MTKQKNKQKLTMFRNINIISLRSKIKKHIRQKVFLTNGLKKYNLEEII